MSGCQTQTQALLPWGGGCREWAKGVGAGEAGFENQWQKQLLLFSNSISKFKNAQRYGQKNRFIPMCLYYYIKKAMRVGGEKEDKYPTMGILRDQTLKFQ